MADLSSSIAGSVNHNIPAKSSSITKPNSYQSSDNSVSRSSSPNFLNKLKNLGNTPKTSLSNSEIRLPSKLKIPEINLEKKIPPREIGSSNRLLRKLASDRKVVGDLGAQDRSVLYVHEDMSTKSTHQSPAEVEFPKKSNQVKDENGTDLALKKVAVDFESHFMGSMWQLALNYPSRVYEGGLGEELFSQELTSELIKKATVITDPRGNQVMGPIASKIYDELKKSK